MSRPRASAARDRAAGARGASRPCGLAAAATLSLSALACQPDYGPLTVSVRVHGTPPDAVVTVDDQPVGRLGVVSRRGLAVFPGKHHITIEREGYFAWDRVFETDHELVQLQVDLEKIPE